MHSHNYIIKISAQKRTALVKKFYNVLKLAGYLKIKTF